MVLQHLVSLLLVFSISSFVGAVPDSHDKRQLPLARVHENCLVNNTVALTFDDGPWIHIKNISDQLTAVGAKGTFFFNGDNWDCIYSSQSMTGIKYVYNAGHQVGSHTWAHLDLAQQSWDKIHDEMWKVEQALQRILGVTPAFMRPPFGSYNNLVRQASAIRNQSLAIWDLDSEDSLGATPAGSKAIYDQALAGKPSTILALNHEVVDTTPQQVLPYILPKLKAAGYRLVTLSECLGPTFLPYHGAIGSPGVPDATWRC